MLQTEYSKSMIMENRIICIVTGKILIMRFIKKQKELMLWYYAPQIIII